jgi:L-threonylcarbamoyladenylate synthase
MKFEQEVAEKIKSGSIVVIPTDTIYGIAASVWSKKAVERAYQIMNRHPQKPFIILISSLKDLALFKVKLDHSTQKILQKIWPGKVSVILPVPSSKFHYLHRGTKTLAFRVPQKPSLRKLLEYTGPLVSSSANPQGKRPAETITQAKKYFGRKIDFYIGKGKIKSLPSTLVKIRNGQISVLRKGADQIPKNILQKNNQ